MKVFILSFLVASSVYAQNYDEAKYKVLFDSAWHTMPSGDEWGADSLIAARWHPRWSCEHIHRWLDEMRYLAYRRDSAIFWSKIKQEWDSIQIPLPKDNNQKKEEEHEVRDDNNITTGELLNPRRRSKIFPLLVFHS